MCIRDRKKHYINSEIKEYLGSYYNSFKALENIKDANWIPVSYTHLDVYKRQELKPGTELLLKAIDCSEKIKGADLIITGEGKACLLYTSPSGQFRGKGTHTHGEKTVEATFHACGYKKSLRNFFKSGGFNQNGGYLLSHCDAVPSA